MERLSAHGGDDLAIRRKTTEGLCRTFVSSHSPSLVWQRNILGNALVRVATWKVCHRHRFRGEVRVTEFDRIVNVFMLA